MNSKFIIAAGVAALVAVTVWQLDWDMSSLEAWFAQHPLLGAAIYVVLVMASVVALLSAAGWWAGCLIAFQIARVGRRYLERITSMQAIDRLEEKVPEARVTGSTPGACASRSTVRSSDCTPRSPNRASVGASDGATLRASPGRAATRRGESRRTQGA